MKTIGKKNLKIIAATSMAIFSLLATFTASFAWFVSRIEEGDDIDDFVVRTTSGKFKSLTFHTLNSKSMHDTYEESTFSFNKEALGTISYDWTTTSFSYSGNTNPALDGYDYLDREQPILMMIELVEEYDSANGDVVDISLITDLNNQVFIGERDETDSTPLYDLLDTTYIVDTGTVVRDEQEVSVNYYGLSNAVQFYPIQLSQNDYTTLNSGDYYTFTNLSNVKSFVSITNSDDSSSFSNTVNIIQTSGKVKYIAIIMDYYSDAIEYIYSTFLGDSTLEGTYEGFLYFKCDWKMEVF